MSTSAHGDDRLAAAVTTCYDRERQLDRSLRWSDVEDALSSELWGRLIASDLLVEEADGFRVTDAAIEEFELVTETADGEAEPEATDASAGALDDLDTSWEWYDKVAGLTAGVLFLGYSMPQIRNVVATFDDVVLGALDAVLPFYAVILVLAVVTGLYSATLQSLLVDGDAMAAYSDQMSALQERRSEAKERGDDEALERIQEEQLDAAGDQLGLFKLQFRPTVWIMLLSIPVFLWLRWEVRGGHLDPTELQPVFPLVGQVGWREAVGPAPAWLAWYLICSVSFGQLVRKTLNLQPGTTGQE
jgi:uncharacterized membrane protein (DUF106 family)